MKCFLHEGQLFFETLERIPVHTDLIVAQANHGCDNGLPMIEAIAALMFGKFDYYFFLNLIEIFLKTFSALCRKTWGISLVFSCINSCKKITLYTTAILI